MASFKENNPILLDFPVKSSLTIRVNNVINVLKSFDENILELQDYVPNEVLVDKYLKPVECSMFTAITELPIRRYVSSKRKAILSKKIKNGVQVGDLWENMQIRCLGMDFLAKAENSKFYTSRTHSNLRPCAYSDTFPSLSVAFGSNLVTAPDEWASFYAGYLLLAILRIGIMWSIRPNIQEKSAIRKSDADLLKNFIESAPEVVLSILQFFEEDTTKLFSPENRKTFQQAIADELTTISIAKNDNLEGNWNFYPLPGELPAEVFIGGWKIAIDELYMDIYE